MFGLFFQTAAILASPGAGFLTVILAVFLFLLGVATTRGHPFGKDRIAVGVNMSATMIVVELAYFLLTTILYHQIIL